MCSHLLCDWRQKRPGLVHESCTSGANRQLVFVQEGHSGVTKLYGGLISGHGLAEHPLFTVVTEPGTPPDNQSGRCCTLTHQTENYLIDDNTSTQRMLIYNRPRYHHSAIATNR